jgi:hypothetical protein
MVERTDAEDEALLRPVTTLGEPFYVRGPGYFVIERRSVYPSYRADRRPTGTYPETGLWEIEGSFPRSRLRDNVVGAHLKT